MRYVRNCFIGNPENQDRTRDFRTGLVASGIAAGVARVGMSPESESASVAYAEGMGTFLATTAIQKIINTCRHRRRNEEAREVRQAEMPLVDEGFAAEVLQDRDAAEEIGPER